MKSQGYSALLRVPGVRENSQIPRVVRGRKSLCMNTRKERAGGLERMDLVRILVLSQQWERVVIRNQTKIISPQLILRQSVM